MFSLLSLQEGISSHTAKLKPTATVVRDGNGKIKVEREELLSQKERDVAVMESHRAGEKRLAAEAKRKGKAKGNVEDDTTSITFPVCTPEEQAAFTISYQDAFNNRKLLNILDEYGVAIVTNILDASQQTELEQNFCDDILQATTLDPTTNTNFSSSRLFDQSLPRGFENGFGFLPARGLPHGKFAWNCRLNPKVQTIFHALYNKDKDITKMESETSQTTTTTTTTTNAPPHNEKNVVDLVTGLDNPFYTPRNTLSTNTNDEWLHVDQNKNIGNWNQSYQSILYVWGSDDDGSTTVICPKSHQLYYDKVMSDTNARMWNFHYTELKTLRTADTLRQQVIEESRRLTIPAGSLLLWDSRTIHQGWRSGARLAMPICWEPRTRRTDSALSRKIWMASTGIPSTHSASEGKVHNYMSRRKRQQPTGTTSTTTSTTVTTKDGDNVTAAMSLRSTFVPWCIRSEFVDEWQSMVGEESSNLLWQDYKNAEENSNSMDSSIQEKVKTFLKGEVLSVL